MLMADRTVRVKLLIEIAISKGTLDNLLLPLRFVDAFQV